MHPKRKLGSELAILSSVLRTGQKHPTSLHKIPLSILIRRFEDSDSARTKVGFRASDLAAITQPSRGMKKMLRAADQNGGKFKSVTGTISGS